MNSISPYQNVWRAGDELESLAVTRFQKLVVKEMHKLYTLFTRVYLHYHFPRPTQCLTLLVSANPIKKTKTKRPHNHTHVCLGVPHKKCFNINIVNRICYTGVFGIVWRDSCSCAILKLSLQTIPRTLAIVVRHQPSTCFRKGEW